MQARIIPEKSSPHDRHHLQHNEIEADVYKLIHLLKDVSETEFPISAFQNELTRECWTDTNGKRITPQQFLDAYRAVGAENFASAYPKFSKHATQVAEADYSFPIIVLGAHVLDGTHRLVKAILENQDTIKAKVITEIPTGAIVKLHTK